MFCFSKFVRTLKRYAINRSLSDEEFVRNLLNPLVTGERVKNRFGELLDLDKTRVSRLMRQQDDVPTVLRNAITAVDIEQKITDGVQDFIDDFIVAEFIPQMFEDLRRLYCSDDSVDATDQSSIPTAYSIESFIYFYLAAIRAGNKVERSDRLCIWSRGSNSINLIEGDLFSYGFGNRTKQRNIVVIPVNTQFDTHISWEYEHADYPLVSAQTVHGVWLKRWEIAGHRQDELKKSISAQLAAVMPDENGKYPCGTIVKVEDEKATYYLLAIAEFDSENRAQSSPQMIENSIVTLLKHYDVYGQGCPMYLPLLGTGRSRANLSYAKSYSLISTTLLKHCQYVQGSIFLVATKEAMKEIHTIVGGSCDD